MLAVGDILPCEQPLFRMRSAQMLTCYCASWYAHMATVCRAEEFGLNRLRHGNGQGKCIKRAAFIWKMLPWKICIGILRRQLMFTHE